MSYGVPGPANLDGPIGCVRVHEAGSADNPGLPAMEDDERQIAAAGLALEQEGHPGFHIRKCVHPSLRHESPDVFVAPDVDERWSMGGRQWEKPNEPTFEGQRLALVKRGYHRRKSPALHANEGTLSCLRSWHGLPTHCGDGRSAGVIIDRPKHNRTHNRTKSTGLGNVVSTNAETT